MRSLLYCLVAFLMPVISGCNAESTLVAFVDSIGEVKSVRISGTVKTQCGDPVEGVLVVRMGTSNHAVFTDLDGHYKTLPDSIAIHLCEGVTVKFWTPEYERSVLVGKCGDRKLNISDWPEEG
jgi:hypothetical protein